MNQDWPKDWDPYDVIIHLLEENEAKTEEIKQLQSAQQHFNKTTAHLLKHNAHLTQALAATIKIQADNVTKLKLMEQQLKELTRITNVPTE